MRKLVLTALLLVFVGAFTAAWLSSSTPEGSPIGDINLAEERIPGTGTTGFGVPPRQAPTSPARSSLTAGGARSATTPESALPISEMTIASAELQPGGYDAPTLTRRSSSGGSTSFGTRSRRSATGSSGSGGFSSLGFGGGGVGGGAGGAAAAPQNGAQAGNTTSFTTDSAKTPAVSSPPAAQAPPAPRPPSGGGIGGGGAAAPAPAVPPSASIAAIVPADPGPAPAAITPIEGAVPPFSPGGSPSPAATPEPATMLLLGTGIAGLYRMRRYLG